MGSTPILEFVLFTAVKTMYLFNVIISLYRGYYFKCQNLFLSNFSEGIKNCQITEIHATKIRL